MICEAAKLLGSLYNKIMNKKCGFCKAVLGSPDPICPERTRYWFKPSYGGNICAYCGFTKIKLHPCKSSPEVLTLITTQQEKHTQFFNFMDTMIAEFQAGNKQAKDIGRKSQERVPVITDVNMHTSVEGTMKLLSNYPHGDPTTNGLGHTIKRNQLWRDGTYQDVVLIPHTPEDEMKCSWNNIQGFRHQKNIHDGEMMENPNQLKELFKDLRATRAANCITGEAIAPPPSQSSSSSSPMVLQVLWLGICKGLRRG